MSEFLNRFFNIRNVVRNVWTQIDEMEPVLSKQAVSLGKKHDESFSQFMRRSRNADTDTVGFVYNDYRDQVNALFRMTSKVEDTLVEISSIYCDLLRILQIDRANDQLGNIDDPDGDITQILNRNVRLDDLDETMYMKLDLVHIADRISNVMYIEGGFHIHDRDNLWRVLRQNRLSVLETGNVPQWPESPPGHEEFEVSKQDELVHKISAEIISMVNERSDATLKKAAVEARRVQRMR